MGLSIRADARHRGVSHVAVLRAVKQGRVSLEPDGTVDPARGSHRPVALAVVRFPWRDDRVAGAARPTVNGHPLTGETVQLKNGDVIELAGTQMQFVQL